MKTKQVKLFEGVIILLLITALICLGVKLRKDIKRQENNYQSNPENKVAIFKNRIL
jgi:hypothetical protein